MCSEVPKSVASFTTGNFERSKPEVVVEWNTPWTSSRIQSSDKISNKHGALREPTVRALYSLAPLTLAIPKSCDSLWKVAK